MSLVRPAALACSLACGAALLPGCRTAATEVDLAFVADCWPEDGRIRLLVWNDEDAMSEWELEPGATRTLVPRGGDASRRYRFEARLLDGGGATVDVQRGEDGYVAGQEIRREVRFEVVCDDAGTGDAGPDAAGSDAGVRSVADLELAYDFAETAGSTASECVQGLEMRLTAGASFAGGGLTLADGRAETDAVPEPVRRRLQLELSVEGWIRLEAVDVAGREPRRVVALYDPSPGLWANELRVSMRSFPWHVLDAGVELDAGAPDDFERFEVLGGLMTSGDRYARPWLAAAASRSELLADRTLHFVYTWAGPGAEHLYLDGVEPAPEWRAAGGVDPGPRSGTTPDLSANARLYLGNHGTLSSRGVDGGVRLDVGAGVDAALDAGTFTELYEVAPAPGDQFRGTYLLLAFYSRALDADEVALHHALGPDASPCR
jgi:hypothetical protein